MLALNWMSPRLISIEPDDSMSMAIRLMKDYDIRHLPVIQDGRLVGIITDRDVKKASASDAAALEVHELAYILSRVKVSDIMTPRPFMVGVFDTIEEAALIMMENKISGLPVVDDEGHVQGMLTQNDIFRALISLTGVAHGGVQFAMDLPDRPGSIKETADIIRRHGGRMVSILTSYDRVPEGRRRVYIRMKGVDRSKMIELNNELSQVGTLLYVLDSRQGKKELLTLGRLKDRSA
ncbi:membrane protein [Desulfocarbo indianensis]|nr:membrane protein [Desulfocarbo indianensis]